MKQQDSRYFRGAAAMLWAFALVGCAHTSAAPQQATKRTESVRVIISFKQAPVIDDGKLAGLLTDTCRCSPQFIRRYLDNALIYQIDLPQDMSFAAFGGTLLENGAALGIRDVEQDSMQHHQ